MLKKLMVCLICISVFFNVSFAEAKSYSPSEWSAEDISNLISNSILPEILNDKDYTQPITRGEFCYLIMNLYAKLSGNSDIFFGSSGFEDTFDITICSAAELGLMNGRSDGMFYPDTPITRQELTAVILRTLKLCGINASVSSEYVYSTLQGFNDSIEIYPWAYESVTFCLIEGIIKGTSDNTVSPNATATREQAMVIASRCFNKYKDNSSQIKPPISKNEYDSLTCYVSGEINFVNFSDRALTFDVSPVNGAVLYKADVNLSADNFWYAESDTFVKSVESTLPQLTVKNMRAGKQYNICVYAIDVEGNVLKMYTGFAFPEERYTLEEKEAIIFGSGEINSKESADAQMTQIKVKVWAVDSNQNKYPSEMTLTVHKNIAQITMFAFEEIFNGEEKFPFKDGGAYSWRDAMSSGRYSHHNYGTAIDLNYNENYCLYKNGSYVGKYYKPYEDIYSFPADGEVVSIFAKYGFIWGGDEWSNPKDYMHFSYLEL